MKKLFFLSVVSFFATACVSSQYAVSEAELDKMLYVAPEERGKSIEVYQVDKSDAVEVSDEAMRSYQSAIENDRNQAEQAMQATPLPADRPQVERQAAAPSGTQYETLRSPSAESVVDGATEVILAPVIVSRHRESRHYYSGPESIRYTNAVRAPGVGSDNAVRAPGVGSDNAVRAPGVGSDNAVRASGVGSDNAVRAPGVGSDNAVRAPGADDSQNYDTQKQSVEQSDNGSAEEDDGSIATALIVAGAVVFASAAFVTYRAVNEGKRFIGTADIDPFSPVYLKHPNGRTEVVNLASLQDSDKGAELFVPEESLVRGNRKNIDRFGLVTRFDLGYYPMKFKMGSKRKNDHSVSRMHGIGYSFSAGYFFNNAWGVLFNGGFAFDPGLLAFIVNAGAEVNYFPLSNVRFSPGLFASAGYAYQMFHAQSVTGDRGSFNGDVGLILDMGLTTTLSLYLKGGFRWQKQATGFVNLGMSVY